MTWEAILGIVGIIIGTGGLAAIITSRSQARKLASEAMLQVQTYYTGALKAQNDHIASLEGRITRLAGRVDELGRALATTETRARRAEAALVDVWGWIDQGAPPPPPTRPPWIIHPASATTPTENID